MADFIRIDDQALRTQAREPLHSMYQLSPFVWRDGGRCQLLLRAVNHDDDAAKKIARIYHGVSGDGLRFLMDEEPVIAPGPQALDRQGCEDPSVALDGERLYVYYTGWNQTENVGRLLAASGADVHSLEKMGVALDSTPMHLNPKEATIVRRHDGTWVLFFEYVRAGRSRLGVALAQNVAGPWTIADDPFEVRQSGWDSWHLSPGPVVNVGSTPVMFYNGGIATPAWRIGWVAFEQDFVTVSRRGLEPLITPPPPQGDETDIAFASSAISLGDEIWLYYSVADKEMRRATLRL